jgi:hypothetical protein
MNNMNITYKQVTSMEFYTSKGGYSSMAIVLKGNDGTRVYVRYEWESDNLDVPTEVIEFLSNNGLSIDENKK